MPTLYHAILTTASIRCPGGPYLINKRYMNGVIVGGLPGEPRIACHIALAKGTKSLRPIVGAYTPLSHEVGAR
jgi:hypothetical protein